MMTVTLRVDSQMLIDYLHYLFPEEEYGLKVSSDTIMGKLIISHCREAPAPIFPPSDDRLVTFVLPKCRSTQSLDNKFLFFSSGDETQLNLALRALFEWDLMAYYHRGEELNFPKKDIVEGFIFSRKLFSKDCFDTLHKRIYRRQQEQLNRLSNKLRRKLYYIDETMDISGLKK